ncbi:MAG: hypothetical protein ACE5I1_05680 [bacterium]
MLESRKINNLRHTIPITFFIFSVLPFASLAQEQQLLGDASDGNRSVPVHLIKLYDEDDSVIRPEEQPLLPFSTRQTCGKCHDYAKISRGLHFNAGVTTATDPGRPGEPWILADPVSATQIPISQRGWPGAYRPAQLGMSALQFIEKFGSHLPGGGIGEDEDAVLPENFLRWQVTGKLEVNCLSCHDAEPAHDQAKYAAQMTKQNFRWAAAASSGFATVSGTAKDMPDNYDLYTGVPPAVSDKTPPSVVYDESRFNSKNEVFFDIVRKIPNARCYFCHSTKTAGHERWHEDDDVHLQASMACVDCHRNGLDHNMVRGYEGELQARENPAVASLTCQGCHLGDENEITASGRLGAPRPEHSGLPPVHFEKMTCTACHSGALPEKHTARIKTSRSHKLGTYSPNKNDEALPYIVAPVFAEQEDGKIAPHKLLWPAFWAELTGDSLRPLVPETVRPFVQEFFLGDTLRAPGNWAALTQEAIAVILDTLAAQDSTQRVFAYIAGGRLFRLNQSGALLRHEHPAAKPYLWPLAHDVRPAAQSLGVRGCDDCHATNSPFYFGEIPIATPVAGLQSGKKQMADFQAANSIYQKAFALSFIFRPWLKALMLLSAFVISAVLAIYAFRGFAGILQNMAQE